MDWSWTGSVGIEKAMEHESDGDTNYYWCTW